MIDSDAFILPTIYKGIKYRSRTEARWARFFDAAGIKFFYESEAFALPSGNYLPDFKIFPYGLKCYPVYAEVKGQSFTDSEQIKCFQLCAKARCPVIMLDGPPDFKVYDIFEYEFDFINKKEKRVICEWVNVSLSEVLICSSTSKYAPFFYSPGFDGEYPYFNPKQHSLECIDKDYERCVHAAQNERFGT